MSKPAACVPFGNGGGRKEKGKEEQEEKKKLQEDQGFRGKGSSNGSSHNSSHPLIPFSSSSSSPPPLIAHRHNSLLLLHPTSSSVQHPPPAPPLSLCPPFPLSLSSPPRPPIVCPPPCHSVAPVLRYCYSASPQPPSSDSKNHHPHSHHHSHHHSLHLSTTSLAAANGLPPQQIASPLPLASTSASPLPLKPHKFYTSKSLTRSASSLSSGLSSSSSFFCSSSYTPLALWTDSSSPPFPTFLHESFHHHHHPTTTTTINQHPMAAQVPRYPSPPSLSSSLQLNQLQPIHHHSLPIPSVTGERKHRHRRQPHMERQTTHQRTNQSQTTGSVRHFELRRRHSVSSVSSIDPIAPISPSSSPSSSSSSSSALRTASPSSELPSREDQMGYEEEALSVMLPASSSSSSGNGNGNDSGNGNGNDTGNGNGNDSGSRNGNDSGSGNGNGSSSCSTTTKKKKNGKTNSNRNTVEATNNAIVCFASSVDSPVADYSVPSETTEETRLNEVVATATSTHDDDYDDDDDCDNDDNNHHDHHHHFHADDSVRLHKESDEDDNYYSQNDTNPSLQSTVLPLNGESPKASPLKLGDEASLNITRTRSSISPSSSSSSSSSFFLESKPTNKRSRDVKDKMVAYSAQQKTIRSSAKRPPPIPNKYRNVQNEAIRIPHPVINKGHYFLGRWIKKPEPLERTAELSKLIDFVVHCEAKQKPSFTQHQRTPKEALLLLLNRFSLQQPSEGLGLKDMHSVSGFPLTAERVSEIRRNQKDEPTQTLHSLPPKAVEGEVIIMHKQDDAPNSKKEEAVKGKRTVRRCVGKYSEFDDDDDDRRYKLKSLQQPWSQMSFDKKDYEYTLVSEVEAAVLVWKKRNASSAFSSSYAASKPAVMASSLSKLCSGSYVEGFVRQCIFSQITPEGKVRSTVASYERSR